MTRPIFTHDPQYTHSFPAKVEADSLICYYDAGKRLWRALVEGYPHDPGMVCSKGMEAVGLEAPSGVVKVTRIARTEAGPGDIRVEAVGYEGLLGAENVEGTCVCGDCADYEVEACPGLDLGAKVTRLGKSFGFVETYGLFDVFVFGAPLCSEQLDIGDFAYIRVEPLTGVDIVRALGRTA